MIKEELPKVITQLIVSQPEEKGDPTPMVQLIVEQPTPMIQLIVSQPEKMIWYN